MLGAVDAPEIRIVSWGMVTALAAATVTPLERAPTMATALSMFTKAPAASTPCTGLTAVSRLTMITDCPLTPPARLTCSEANSMAFRRGVPNSDKRTGEGVQVADYQRRFFFGFRLAGRRGQEKEHGNNCQG